MCLIVLPLPADRRNQRRRGRRRKSRANFPSDETSRADCSHYKSSGIRARLLSGRPLRQRRRILIIMTNSARRLPPLRLRLATDMRPTCLRSNFLDFGTSAARVDFNAVGRIGSSKCESVFLITGGAGFIGRHVVRKLIAEGYEVRILDSFIEQVHGPDGAVRARKALDGIEIDVGDVRDEEAMARALRGVDSVIHLAAEVGVGQSMYAIDRYVSCNDLGTACLFQRLIEEPVRRVVVASSMSVYGEGLYRDADGALVRNRGSPPAWRSRNGILSTRKAARSPRLPRRNGSARIYLRSTP